MAWFTVEHPVLVAAVRLAAETGLRTPHAWQLARTLVEFLDRRGHWQDWSDTLQIGVDSARRLADRTGQIYSLRQLALVRARLGRYDEAGAHLREALRMADSSPVQAGHVYHGLAWLAGLLGRHEEALGHAQRSLALFRSTGHLFGQARAYNAIGWSHSKLGNPQLAIVECRQALDLLQEINDRVGEACTWDSLADAYHRVGDHDQALACYQRAVDQFRLLGNRGGEAVSLRRLGEVHCDKGDWDEAVALETPHFLAASVVETPSPSRTSTCRSRSVSRDTASSAPRSRALAAGLAT